MTKEEIDILWQNAMQESIKDGEMYTRYRFAKFVKDKVLEEHAMRKVQRIGQEIEQKIGCVNHDCDQCKAQPEQEPVAWIERDIQCDDFDPDSVTCEKPTIATDGWEWVGLYTTPPQRTWVGLTDEDMYVVSEEESCSFIAGAKWSEEILKEKNT